MGLRRQQTLFTFVPVPPSQWKGARTTHSTLHEEFSPPIRTRVVPGFGQNAVVLFWAASLPVPQSRRVADPRLEPLYSAN
jgi:hypothetical protein